VLLNGGKFVSPYGMMEQWNASSRRREFRGMRRTYVRRSEHEMKRNAEIGLFTKPSKIMGLKVENHITTDVDQNCLLF